MDEKWSEAMATEDKIVHNKHETLNLDGPAVRPGGDDFEKQAQHQRGEYHGHLLWEWRQHHQLCGSPCSECVSAVSCGTEWVVSVVDHLRNGNHRGRSQGFNSPDKKRLFPTLTRASSTGTIWDMIDRDQGNFDFKMMVFLWFSDGVILREHKRVQTDIQQSVNARPVTTRDCNVRATIEIELVWRPWDKAQAIFLTR